MKFLIFITFILGATWSMADDRISDKEIKTTLIHQSIEDYGRSCPCPYSKSPSGGQCGLSLNIFSQFVGQCLKFGTIHLYA